MHRRRSLRLLHHHLLRLWLLLVVKLRLRLLHSPIEVLLLLWKLSSSPFTASSAEYVTVLTVIAHRVVAAETVEQGLPAGLLAGLKQAADRVRLLAIRRRALLGSRRRPDRQVSLVQLLAAIAAGEPARAPLVVDDG